MGAAPAATEQVDPVDTSSEDRSLWLPVLVLAIAAAVIAVVVQRNVWATGSGDADEFLYQFQARMLLGGHLSLPSSQGRFFAVWLSGPANGRRVLPFTWTWPAVLAVSQALFGTMLVAIGAAAAAATTSCYLFAAELLGDRRRALLAAVLFTFTPFVAVLGGTYLNYLFALALLLAFGWLLLSGLRLGSTGRALGAGALWALLLFTRPFDGILAAVPFAVILLFQHRRRLADLIRPAVAFAVGATPVLALMLLANLGTTGKLLTFPTTAQSGGAAKFGWGLRGLTAGAPESINFSFTTATHSLGRNLAALPGWTLGSYVGLAVAVYGAVLLRREHGRNLGILVGIVLVYPLGYLTWFASELTVAGAANGIGPHYYLPLVVPVVILMAVAGSALWHRRKVLTLGIVAAVLLISPSALSSKWDTERLVRTVHREYEGAAARALAPWSHQNILVVLEPATIADTDGLGRLWPTLVNRPDLKGRQLFAIDRGADEIDLLRAYPSRLALRLVRRYEPGDDLTKPRLVAKPMTVLAGPSISFHTHIVNTSGSPVITAFVSQGGHSTSTVLDTHSVKGRTYTVVWVIDADGSVHLLDQAPGTVGGPTSTLDAASSLTVGSSGSIDVGVSAATEHPAPNTFPTRWVRSYDYRRTGNAVELLTGDVERVSFGGASNGSLPLDVGQQLQIDPQRS